MKNFKMKPRLIALFALAIGFLTLSWGIVGHERINKAAVMALPRPLQIFFYNHIDFITQEASVPDIRKYALNYKDENPRHYFDMENFGSADSLPKTMEEAKKKYDAKFLNDNGILPWYIEDLMVKLTKAFKDKNRVEILFLAADLGHYVGDAHMPLHTSANHDGQLSDQKGIHSLWESRLPELFAKNYKLNVPLAHYYEDVHKATWDMINDTHSLAQPLLDIDKKLRTSTPENQVYVVDADGKIVKNKYNSAKFSDDYAAKLNKELNGMVESQMKKAIVATSSFWYTAWVNAGKPDLSDLDSPSLTQRNNEALKEDVKLFQNGDLFGMKNQND
ncbi:zinc dependent phospholipase C family protein [Flavobacterium sp. ANB]|uniref:zinc dependent phospholipase C family protein n=1 Tax=unclassified Flavobacterium TaxID=196869 RepID=UPI0012B739D0|nr:MULTISPECIES: zinc dependent phospholipase C family protein [unclassified Flavobacterium]MBF4515709.1 zinc dependent phospholipase C family protein [Flavobacterium sp. ANB]MTD68712.1 S1/P1 Nuclease [Flavobacterium sp. LC2016-13]